MNKKIKIEISKSTAYSVWETDTNILIGVIVKDPSEKDGDEVDVTKKVKDMICDHNVAYSVDIESISGDVVIESISGDVVLRPGGFNKIEVEASILEEKGEQPDLRIYEIVPIAAY